MCSQEKTIKNLSSILDKSKILALYEELELNDNLRPHEVSSSLYSQMHTKVKMEEINKEEISKNSEIKTTEIKKSHQLIQVLKKRVQTKKS